MNRKAVFGMTMTSLGVRGHGKWRGRRCAVVLAGLVALGVDSGARAAVLPVCDPTIPDLSGCCYKLPNPVFVAGTSAAKSALQAIAKQLTDITIVYQTPDSCIALTDVVAVQAATSSNVVTTVLAADGTTPGCALSPAALNNPDEAINIAVSDIFPATCQSVLGTGGITVGQQIDVYGPIQAQTIDVPSASTAKSISAEAAYDVFGYAADTAAHSVPPWTVPTSVFIRPSTSGTLNLIGTVIGLPGAKWANATSTTSVQVTKSSADMFTAISTPATNVDATIGILSAQFVLQQNTKALAAGGTGKTIKTLAFQAAGQSCGYFPDSTENKGDKLNVRQGRYAIWGPAHLVTNIGPDGNPKGAHAAAVAAVLNAFIATGCEGGSCPTGTGKLLGVAAGASGADGGMSTADGGTSGADGGVAPPSAALKKAVIDAESAPSGGVVPWCAMEVMRSLEGGAESSYQPSEPCGCYFEKLATGAPVSPHCTACPIGNECVAPYSVCRLGYCEAK
jgi:hypothetical protein